MSEDTNYTVELRDDQWELIVLAMRHIRGMSNCPESSYSVDRLGRLFLLRRVKEIETDITAVVGEIEK